MSTGDPEILHRSEWDRALFWMVLLSALVHVVAIVVILLLPDRFGLRAHPEQAYVVDLVSSDQLAGTNLVPGGKGKVAAPKKVEAKPPPPPPRVAEVKKKEEPPPKKEAPPPPEKAAVVIAAATKPKPAAPTPTPVVEAQAAPSPTKPKPEPKAEAKAKKEEKPKVEPTHAAVAKKRAAEKPARTPTLTKKEKEALAARERDERIAKAIERVQQEGAGSGAGHKGKEKGGGPLSLGTGQGPGGGVVMGIEYLMYRNQLETRLKQAWAWAGKRDLEATVHFRIGEDGRIFDVRITKSSGDAAYDESVVRAVRTVNPLSPPPQAYRKEFSDVEYTFTPQNMG